MEQIVFYTQSGNKYICDISAGIIMPIGDQNEIDILQNISKVFSKTYKLCTPAIETEDVAKCIASLPQVVFEMTSKCNLSCKYCCYGDGYTTFKDRVSGKLNPRVAECVLDYLCEKFNIANNASSEPFVISFYGGEPLLEIDSIKRIVNYTKNKNFSNREVKFSMTTNGLLLKKHIDFLVKNDFHLLVSLDGNIDNNRYRVDKNGNISFNIVLDNLMYVKQHYPEYFKSINYNCVYTNISSLDQILEFFRHTLGKTPTISLLHEPDIDAPGYNEVKEMICKLDTSDANALSDDIFTEIPINKLVASFLLNLVRNTYYSEINLANYSKISKFNTGTCVPFSKRMFVTHTGNICLCEKIPRVSDYGKVNTDAWRVEIDTEKIAAKFNSDVTSALNLCSKCYMQKCCNQCIYQFKDGKCPSYKNKEDFTKLLAKAFTYIETYPEIVELIRTKFIIR